MMLSFGVMPFEPLTRRWFVSTLSSLTMSPSSGIAKTIFTVPLTSVGDGVTQSARVIAVNPVLSAIPRPTLTRFADFLRTSISANGLVKRLLLELANLSSHESGIPDSQAIDKTALSRHVRAALQAHYSALLDQWQTLQDPHLLRALAGFTIPKDLTDCAISEAINNNRQFIGSFSEYLATELNDPGLPALLDSFSGNPGMGRGTYPPQSLLYTHIHDLDDMILSDQLQLPKEVLDVVTETYLEIVNSIRILVLDPNGLGDSIAEKLEARHSTETNASKIPENHQDPTIPYERRFELLETLALRHPEGFCLEQMRRDCHVFKVPRNNSNMIVNGPQHGCQKEHPKLIPPTPPPQ